MQIQPRTQQNAFNLTVPPRAERALSMFPPRPLAADDRRLAPVAPASGRLDSGLDLERLLRALGGQTVEHRSRGKLDLDTASAERPSRLTSIAELNGSGTSYQKVRLSFGDSSTVATLSGVYAAGGAAATATSLRLEFTASASIGHSDSAMKFRVLDQSDKVLFAYDGNARAGDVLSLGDDLGLSVSFSAGSAAAAASSTTTVSASQGTTVNSAARFNDADFNSRPRFSGGAQVVAGSFLVNGVTINVRADDTVASVLQRISESLPDVTADLRSDKVVLETRSSSSAGISISNDTSGFVSAVQLRGAVTDRGNLRDDQEPLAQLKQFAAVQAGGFSVNGLFVSINPATDTLASTLARILSLDAPVQAYYDSGQGAVFLREAEGTTLFGDDSSGFLKAVGISREPPPSLGPLLQLAPHVAQSVARLLEGNLADLATESAQEPEPPTPKDKPRDKPAAARRAQTAYQRDSDSWLNEESPPPTRLTIPA